MAEGTTLLTWQGVKSLESSNLSLSAAKRSEANKMINATKLLWSHKDSNAGAMFCDASRRAEPRGGG